ncbi:hypothetical protein ABI59_16140 [Acidobacteria bacterium Mor1]|nr:hypothetical protein ABI59_16140 [Acidobacteria bacterium Mor1]
MSESSGRPGTIDSLLRAVTWRTVSVSLLSFAAGIPLGLVWIAIPDWMNSVGVDIRVVGALSLAQAPWSFKFLWSPLMDRYTPPWWGRRRGWASLTQIAMAVLIFAVGGVGGHPDAAWVIAALALAIGFAAASHDIAIDAYAVEVLRKEEQGIAVGARTAVYRAAMLLAGGYAISLAAEFSWQFVCAGLALCYLPMLSVTWKAPEPPRDHAPPRSLREAVWLPFVGALRRHRALEILAFVVLYKLADNLSQALLRPFLENMGYSAFDRGFAFSTIGFLVTLAGTFIGGIACTPLGLGRALWIFGGLQIFSNIGYVLITYDPGNRPLMYAAMSFEVFATGLGMGAFGVFLLRLTQKRFSATQYALFSSLFGLPRILAGPATGFAVDALGWRTFFWITIAAGVPGLLFLQRFAPIGEREPRFEIEAATTSRSYSRSGLLLRGIAGGIVGFLLSTLLWSTLQAAKAVRAEGGAFDLPAALSTILQPQNAGGALQLLALVITGVILGLMTAAVFAARSANTES